MAIPNRFDIVQAVDAAHPHLIQANTKATVTEFLWRVVDQLARADPGFGFLSKSAAENHTDIPGAGMVALDALCYLYEHNSVDIAGSAGDGPGSGSIGWSEDEHRRPSNAWVKAVPYPDGPAPPNPEPPEPPSTDIEARVAALEAWQATVEPRIESANTLATAAMAKASECESRMGNLTATGKINVPVVVEGIRARAKGDVALRVTE